MVLKEVSVDNLQRPFFTEDYSKSKPLALFTESVVALLSRPTAHSAFVDLLSLMGQTFPISAPALYVRVPGDGARVYSVLDLEKGGHKDASQVLRKGGRTGDFSYFKIIIGGHPPVIQQRKYMTIINNAKASVTLSINKCIHDGIFKEWVKILAPAVDKLIDNEQLKDMAYRDKLTGLLNYRAFEQMLDMECERASRYEAIFSIIMIDIDRFKEVNDNFGHQVGDLALKRMTEKILGCVRKSDMCFRYGGEEFVIIMPHTDIGRAKKLAIRMKDKIACMNLIAGKNITVSMGISQYMDGLSSHDLVKRADMGLYDAKNGGRNRIEIFKDSK